MITIRACNVDTDSKPVFTIIIATTHIINNNNKFTKEITQINLTKQYCIKLTHLILTMVATSMIAT